MDVFNHHIYEYEKGLRNLILHTTKAEYGDLVEKKLNDRNIQYIINKVDKEKINVFFGSKYCIDVVKAIGKDYLGSYSDEEDFMLGIMLGYDRIKQCERFLKRKFAKEIVETLVG